MKQIVIALVVLGTLRAACAHPTGNMVVIDGTVLWSYVCPVGNPEHRACVMRWEEEAGARPWLVSSFSASDWMMSPAANGQVYLVERYFDHAAQANKARLLIASVGSEPQELIPWFDDTHRFGEGGFAAMEDGRFLFARYPHLYVLHPDGSESIWKAWPEPVFSVRPVRDGALLIRGESEAWLTARDGTVLEHWSGLLQELTAEPPFMGNRVFDADYADGSLWLAYWGQRRFDVIEGGIRTIVKSFDVPWLPHAVAVDGPSAFMLASTIAPGTDEQIRPGLWRLQGETLEVLWGEADTETGVGLGAPGAYTLSGGFPNPFARQVTFALGVAHRQEVQVSVFDLQGRLVTVLFSGRLQPGDQRTLVWEAGPAPSGLYMVAIEGETFEAARHVLRIR